MRATGLILRATSRVSLGEDRTLSPLPNPLRENNRP